MIHPRKLTKTQNTVRIITGCAYSQMYSSATPKLSCFSHSHLLSLSADVTATTCTGRNVLHYAAESGDLNILNKLIKELKVSLVCRKMNATGSRNDHSVTQRSFSHA